MEKSADALIVGAGIVGCSIAFNLARKDKSVIVLEAAEIGSGTTSRGRGGIRKQFSTAENIMLSKQSFRILEGFHKLTGFSPAFTADGYLFLATSEPDLRVLRNNLELQQSLEVDVQELSANEVKDLVPFMETSDIIGANFCSSDGHFDNNMVLQGYVKAAKALGVQFLEHTKVTAVRVENGQVKGVETQTGLFEGASVAIAAGPRSAELSAGFEVAIPISPRKRQVFVTEPLDQLPVLPLIVDMGQKLGIAREGRGILIGTDEDPKNPNDLNVEWDGAARTFAKAVRRMPFLANIRLRTAWAGFYEQTPDSNPIIGQIGKLQGLFCAAGFSGHGFMHAPAVGEIMADLIVGDRPKLDISPFSLERFSGPVYKGERFVV